MNDPHGHAQPVDAAGMYPASYSEKGRPPKKCVLQPWVHGLTMMQQSVLITSTRGPDGIEKDHVAKLLQRWLRRCFMLSAFDGEALTDPRDPHGGSFTGASLPEGNGGPWEPGMDGLVSDYIRQLDRLPHHFQLHFLHAAEILGYKHTDGRIRLWWNRVYLRLVNDLHLSPETEKRMDWRLGDKREQWLGAEEVTALGPSG